VVPLAIGASYPVVFVAGGVAVYLLPLAWREGRAARLLFAAYGAALLLSFGTVYLLVGRAQVDPAAVTTGEFMLSYWRPGFPPDSLADVPLWLLDRHTNRGFEYPIGDNHGASTATFLLFLAGVAWCWRNGSRPLLVLCLVPFALNMVASVMGKYPYTGCSRLSQHLAPAICLLAGVGWASLLAWFAPRLADRLVWVRVAVGMLLVFLVGSLMTRSLNLHHDTTAEFHQRLYRQLDAVCRAGDRIVYPVGAPQDTPMQWHLVRLGPRAVALSSGEKPPPAERVWVMTSYFGRPDEAAHRKFLDSVKPAGYRAGFTTWHVHKPGFVQEKWGSMWCYGVTCLAPPDDPDPLPLLFNP
jgi:hypothetical protein